MDLGSCSLNKYIIWAANFAVFVLACASFGVGFHAHNDNKVLSNFLDPFNIAELSFYRGSIFIIVVSTFALLITFLGCYGALKVRLFYKFYIHERKSV